MVRANDWEELMVPNIDAGDRYSMAVWLRVLQQDILCSVYYDQVPSVILVLNV